MSVQQHVTRLGVLPPVGRRICRILLLVLALPILLLASCAFYVNYVPAYSASFHIKEADTTVSLSFYWLWDERGDNSGRYFTVRSPKGRGTNQICGFDWAHFPLTRVYLASDGTIGVQSSGECRAFASPALIVTENIPVTWTGWRYIGAFDLVLQPERGPGARQMHFNPAAEQPR